MQSLRRWISAPETDKVLLEKSQEITLNDSSPAYVRYKFTILWYVIPVQSSTLKKTWLELFMQQMKKNIMSDTGFATNFVHVRHVMQITCKIRVAWARIQYTKIQYT